MMFRGALLSIFLHSRNTTMHASHDRQLLTTRLRNTDMRRSSTKFKMSSSFRYVLSCLWALPAMFPSLRRLLIIVRWFTEKLEQCLRIRSRPFALCPHCCFEGCEESERLPYCRTDLRGYVARCRNLPRHMGTSIVAGRDIG